MKSAHHRRLTEAEAGELPGVHLRLSESTLLATTITGAPWRLTSWPTTESSP